MSEIRYRVGNDLDFEQYMAAAEKYYPHVGFAPHHSAWLKKPGE